ncbi:TPR repeat-containing protein, partial [mine drainage metagenome]
MASFWLDRQIWPHSLFAFNLTNVFFHLAAGTFAFLLARALFRQAGNRESVSRSMGFWIGAFFLIEPMQVATVLYTVQRMALLAALFMFAGVWCYLEARSRSQKGKPAAVWFFLALFLCPFMALFSKENGALTPVLTLAAELLFFRFRGPDRIRRMILVYFGALTALALGLINLAIFDRSFIRSGYGGRGFTLGVRLLTESRVLVRYLFMPFLPTASRISFFHDDLTLSHGLMHPPSTTIACLILAALAVLALALWKKRPLISFGIGWFFIGQLLESTFIPLEIMFVHRNYLPVFGLLVAAADGLWAMVPRLLSWLRIQPAGSVGTQLVRLAPLPVWSLFAILTFHQASLWSHPLRFYREGVQTHPHSATAISGLAQVEFDRGDPHAAIALLRQSGITGAILQADVYRCLLHGRIRAAELRPTLIPVRARHFSAYPITTLTHLAILGLTGHC